MSTNTKAISDDIIEAAKKSADALITRMCVTMDHSFGLQSEQEQRGLRTSMTQLAEHDIAPAIAEAIHDAVMAERERWSPVSIYFERYCQDEADAAENCISEQQHIDAKALAAVVRGEG